MAGQKEIEVEIMPNGETKITVKGHAGPACMAEADAMLRALGGGDVKEKKKTQEFYQGDATGTQGSVGGGR